MSPLYEYRCPEGHITRRLRTYIERDEPVACKVCDAATERLFPLTHAPPDGIYSYCPNIGNREKHARRTEQIAKREEARKHGEPAPVVVDAE